MRYSSCLIKRKLGTDMYTGFFHNMAKNHQDVKKTYTREEWNYDSMHDCVIWQNTNWFPYLNNTNTLGKTEIGWSDNMSFWRETLYIFQSFKTRRIVQFSFEKQINHHLLLSLHLANLTYMRSESYLPTLYYFTEGDAHVHLNSCKNPLPSKKNCTVVDNRSSIEDQSICIQVSSHCPLHMIRLKRLIRQGPGVSVV